MLNHERTLYIGAHEDDVFIGAAISIHRDPSNAYVLTVADGVSHNVYPAEFFGLTFQSREEFIRTRLKEDKKAMTALGLNLADQYANLQLPNERTYLFIPDIVRAIQSLVIKKNIERIVTHEFPQSHPDHEIVSFCSHIVGQKNGVEVWEYPMYGFRNNKHIDREFLTRDHSEIVTIFFTQDEIELRERSIRIYKSQAFIKDRFRAVSEIFGKVDRNFLTIPSTFHYFYKNELGHPQPLEIRKQIKSFLATLKDK